MIVLLHAPDPAFVKEASKRGVFAHISDADVEDWQSSIDIVLRRFAEYHDLEGAFGRRALIERAKGILMERHSIDENSAFELLREHSRSTTASSSTSPPPSSTATAYSRRDYTLLLGPRRGRIVPLTLEPPGRMRSSPRSGVRGRHRGLTARPPD